MTNVENQKSLQLLQSVFPSHIYVNETENVVLGVYQRRGGAQTLVRVAESEDSVPICVSLKDANDCILDEGDCWSMSCLSESLEISAAKLTLKIAFRSVPECQPLKFEFCANTVNDDGEDMITPFITEPFRVCRYELEVAQQPDPIYYKDDGGFRNNHLICGVRVLDHETKRPVKGRRIPIQCRLETENGDRLDFMIKQRVKRPRPNKKGRKKPNSSAVGEAVKVKYLMIHPTTPEIQPSTGNVSFGVRINDVSQNHHNQQFVLVIEPDWKNCPAVSDVWGCRTRKILVKSKSPEKLAHQKILAKRRNQRKATSVESCSSVTPDESNTTTVPPVSAASDKSSFFPPAIGEDTMMDVSHSSLKRQLTSDNHMISINNNKSNRYSTGKLSSRKRKLNSARSTDHPLHEDPSDLNCVPSHRWFPAMRKIVNSTDDNDDGTSEEEARALWMRQAFSLLGWREWICVGYQCQYLDPSLQPHCLLHPDDDHNQNRNSSNKKNANRKNSNKNRNGSNDDPVKSETCTKTMGYKIVRCLLCGAEGPWTAASKPSHKPSCSLRMLKESYLPLKAECESMGVWPNPEDITITDPPPTTMTTNSTTACKSELATALQLSGVMDPWPSHLPPPVFTPDAHLQASVAASNLVMGDPSSSSMSRSSIHHHTGIPKPEQLIIPPTMPPTLNFDGSTTTTTDAFSSSAGGAHIGLAGLPPTPIFSNGTEIPAATLVSATTAAGVPDSNGQNNETSCYPGIPPIKRQATAGSGPMSSSLNPANAATNVSSTSANVIPPVQPGTISFDESGRLDSRFSGLRLPLLLSTIPNTTATAMTKPMNNHGSTTVPIAPKIEESLEDTKETDSTRNFHSGFTALASPMLARQSPFGASLLSPMGNGIPPSPMAGLFSMFPTPFGMAMASPNIAHNGSMIPFAHHLDGMTLPQAQQQPTIPDSLLGNPSSNVASNSGDNSDSMNNNTINNHMDVAQQLSVPALSRVSSFVEDRKSAGEECSTDSTNDTLDQNGPLNRSSTGSSVGGIPALEDDNPTLSLIPPLLPPSLAQQSIPNLTHNLGSTKDNGSTIPHCDNPSSSSMMIHPS